MCETISTTYNLSIDEYDNDIKCIIIMATFNRRNGKTPEYLEKSLNSIISQKYKNWDLIIVGDKYEPEDELLTIINKYRNLCKYNNKIIYINNQTVERDYVKHSTNLWCCAGATSINKGLDYARSSGYKYYCHLDDDDYWNEFHLQALYEVYKKYSNCVFVNTKSTYCGRYLPVENIDIYPNNRMPLSCQTIHSSFSFRIDIVPFNYATSLTEHGISFASDANMLDKIKDFIINSGEKYTSIYNCKFTCFHDFEGNGI